MSKYRKKPVVVEALIFDGSRESGDLIRDKWYEVTFGLTDDPVHGFMWDGTLQIPTPEGTMTARAGDYIIQGVKGEIYPCKPGIFKARYEQVE